jgi:hypothetical protein
MISTGASMDVAASRALVSRNARGSMDGSASIEAPGAPGSGRRGSSSVMINDKGSGAAGSRRPSLVEAFAPRRNARPIRIASASSLARSSSESSGIAGVRSLDSAVPTRACMRATEVATIVPPDRPGRPCPRFRSTSSRSLAVRAQLRVARVLHRAPVHMFVRRERVASRE